MKHDVRLSVSVVSLLAVGATACARDERVLRSESPVDGAGGGAAKLLHDAGAAKLLHDAGAAPLGPDTGMAIAFHDSGPMTAPNQCIEQSCATGSTWDPESCTCVTQTACNCASPGGTCMYASSSRGEDGVVVGLQASPPVPALGDHQVLTLTITGPDGQPISAYTPVAVSCLMTHGGFTHGCPAAITVTRTGDTFTASPVIYNMQGSWQLIVKVDTENIVFDYCVQ